MSKGAALLYGRDIALDDMEVCAANRCPTELDDGLIAAGDFGDVFVDDFDFADAVVG